jgi:hypothetical protein
MTDTQISILLLLCFIGGLATGVLCFIDHFRKQTRKDMNMTDSTR